ncbi:hypothetical protein CR513_32821, partial [Mucuna pruriens]
MNEEALVQLVPNIDSNVVVCGYIDSRTWELVVDSNDLQKQCRQDMRAITKIYQTLGQSNKQLIMPFSQPFTNYYLPVSHDADLQVRLEILHEHTQPHKKKKGWREKARNLLRNSKRGGSDGIRKKVGLDVVERREENASIPLLFSLGVKTSSILSKQTLEEAE